MEVDANLIGSQLNERGIALAKSGQMDAARQCFEQAIRVRPDFAGAYNNLGNVFRRLGDASNAEESFLRAIAFDPNDAHAQANLANLYWNAGRLVEALALFRSAVRNLPTLAEAQRGLGAVLAEMGRTGEALATLRQRVSNEPNSAEAHMELGKVLHEARQHAETEVEYRRALELDPNMAAGHANLAFLLSDQGRVDEAYRHYDRAYTLTPSPRLRIVRDTMLPPILASHGHLTEVRQRLIDNLRRMEADGVEIDVSQHVMPTLFYLAYHGLNDREIYAALGRRAAQTRAVAPRLAPQRRAGKVRVGFLSKCLRDHTIGRLNQNLIAYLPREEFEVVFLSVGDSSDAIGQAIRARADRYIVVPQNLAAALPLVAQQELDVLFYPDIGMDPFTYTMSFSRLAPVQCLTWGHPDTTGLPTMDYFVSCRHCETPRSADAYSERVVPLSRLGVCYERLTPADHASSRQHFGFRPDEHIYCCPQTLFKFHPDFDAVLADILRRDERGILLLLDARHGYWRELLLERWQRVMPDVVPRIRFIGSLPRAEYLQLLAASDVLLDPLHFGGGNSSYEGLAMGTPIVSLPSDFLRGRLTYAMYAQMEYHDLVVSTGQAYADLCIELGTNRERQAAVRRELLQRTPMLYDDRAIVGEVAAFLHQAAGR